MKLVVFIWNIPLYSKTLGGTGWYFVMWVYETLLKLSFSNQEIPRQSQFSNSIQNSLFSPEIQCFLFKATLKGSQQQLRSWIGKDLPVVSFSEDEKIGLLHYKSNFLRFLPLIFVAIGNFVLDKNMDFYWKSYTHEKRDSSLSGEDRSIRMIIKIHKRNKDCTFWKCFLPQKQIFSKTFCRIGLKYSFWKHKRNLMKIFSTKKVAKEWQFQ